MLCNFANCLLQHLQRDRVYGGLADLKTYAWLCYSAYSFTPINVDMTRIFTEGHSGAYLGTMGSVRIIATILYSRASDLTIIISLCPRNPECGCSALWQ